MNERHDLRALGTVPADGKEGAGRHSTADLLGLAAMPTFAVMAAATSILEANSASMLCMGEYGSMLSGMAPMYTLMSVFHLPAWLRLVSGRRQVGSSVVGRSSVPHTKLHSTVHCLGIDVDDELAISE